MLVAWETLETAEQPPYIQDFAGDLASGRQDRVLEDARVLSSARSRIERAFDAVAIRQLKASTARDITVGGPHLAAQAFRAGLVDECHLFLAPIVVGGGTSSLPDDVRVGLELVDERRFRNGTVHLRYHTTT